VELHTLVVSNAVPFLRMLSPLLETQGERERKNSRQMVWVATVFSLWFTRFFMFSPTWSYGI